MLNVRSSLLLLAVISWSGCSLQLDAERVQCRKDVDCIALGLFESVCEDTFCVPAPLDDTTPWGCVGEVEWATATATPLTMHPAIVRLSNSQPIAGASAKLCSPLDLTCSTPLDEAISDSEGVFNLEAHFGFRGYTIIPAPASYPEMTPAIIWGNPPLYEESTTASPAQMTSSAELGAVGGILGIPLNTSGGHLFGLVHDCLGQPAANVQLQADVVEEDTFPYYVVGGLPTKTATHTDSSGLAGFLNLPEGLVTISANSMEVGYIGSVTVFIKAGHITFVLNLPTPQ